MKNLLLIVTFACLAGRAAAAEAESGFQPLMDGKTFAGWKMATENTNTFRIEDGAFVAQGNRCHLFYVGADQPFKDFHLKVEVQTATNSNGGIYFHTQYQPFGWPIAGFETQVNNTGKDKIKTGSLYGLVNIHHQFVTDGKWWTQEIIVEKGKVTVKVDGAIVLEYVQPLGATAGKDFGRVLAQGTFALQGHDPGSVVRYRNIRVKRL